MTNFVSKVDLSSKYQKLFGMPEGQDARILGLRARKAMEDDLIPIHVALDDSRAATLKDLIAFFAPDVKVVIFPAWDCLPYDRVSPNSELVAQRVTALTTILAWRNERKREPRLVITTVNAITQRVTPIEILQKSSFSAKKGGRLILVQLQAFLAHNGYVRTDTVRETGEFAIRGGIIDLFPPGYDDPIRIDLFGDEIDTIRTFDPITQRTDQKIDAFTLQPATEYILDEDSIGRFRSGYRENFGVVRSNDPLYEAVSEGRRYNGMDHWLPLFFEGMNTLFDYVPENSPLTLDPQTPQSVTERFAQIVDFYQARKTLEASVGAAKKKDKGDVSLTGSIYHPLDPKELYIDATEWLVLTSGAIEISSFAGAEGSASGEGQKGRDFGDIRALPQGDVLGAASEYISHHRKQGRKTLIAAYSQGSRDRLRALLLNAEYNNFLDIASPEDIKKLTPYMIGMAIIPLESGFIAPDMIVLTEQDILGDRMARRAKKRRRADNFLTEVSSLSPGDLVVHNDHGVGRFIGLETLKAGKLLHDCLKLEYAGGDKLYVPVENIEILSRFGSDEGTTTLDKLGGAGWQARKAKVKKDLMIIADGLLKIAAERALQKGELFTIDAETYRSFTDKFPYQETDDQLRAIQDSLNDMASGQPMDRLVCGDVGFGKTEIALRSAYVAAMSGAQVAVVVPTTLLARQHFNNFDKRFSGSGLRVQQLSRMVSARDAELTRNELKEGTCNIVIGTHAILSKHVNFAQLGLVIVDEEQRFGVKQKEKLKELRNNVHMLTLTATPIPRTLQMALTGVRDMSVIATPPVDRMAIRTFVLPTDPVVIREALMREHYRGGQSFYVVPRIKDLQEIEDFLKEIAPELKTISAHGQMSPTELEERMTDFYDGRYDVLLATNIIENGIDIATANTMIIHRADMFGLAQLYQIRGRIGRSKVRAYAYLTYAPNKALNPDAQKRLEVMETLDTLGAGFQLASHDMDIRGAGNLLGEEQSGHIREVGVELYQQMLEEAVAAARAGLDWDDTNKAMDSWSPTINLGTSVLIPDHYVEDLNVRMSLYRRLSELEDKNAIEAFAAECIDRFGPIPDELENLMQIVELKQLCRAAGVSKLEAGPKGAVISFHKDAPPNVGKLMSWMTTKGMGIKLRHDSKLVAVRAWDDMNQRVRGCRSLLKELVDCAS
jgi:transcription-repair coupling factor (superfamily II helicase)